MPTTDDTGILESLVAEIRELKALVQRQTLERGRLYSVKEIATLTGLHEKTIQKGYYEGRYKGYRNGRALRFDLDEIRAVMRRDGAP
jgi:excisionase family DNA binding protein